MTLSRAHTAAKAADVTKLLVLNKHLATHPPMRIMVVLHLTVSLTPPYPNTNVM